MRIECPIENFEDLFNSEEDDFFTGCEMVSFTDYVKTVTDSLLDFYNKDVIISLDRLGMMMNITGCMIDFRTYTPKLWAMSLISYLSRKIGSLDSRTSPHHINYIPRALNFNEPDFYNDKFLPISCMLIAKDFDDCYKTLYDFNVIKEMAMNMPIGYFRDRLYENITKRHNVLNFKEAKFNSTDMNIYNTNEILTC